MRNLERMNNTNMVSIIIVNYRAWPSLEACLDSLEGLTSKELTLEVIVVDNFSNDDQFDVFRKRYQNFIFFENSGNNGFSNGCNQGAKLATGSYLLFLNPDTIVNDGVLETLVSVYDTDPEIGILSCLQIDEKGVFENQNKLFPVFSRFFGVFRSIERKLNKQYYLDRFSVNDNELLYPDWVSGSVVFINREWFDKVSGWNEDYWMYMEDIDLSKRVTGLGAKIAVTRQATIFHAHGGASRINMKTKALTKTEVIISKHVFISNFMGTFEAMVLHTLMITGFLLERMVLALLGIILFFNKKLSVNIYIFRSLVAYYMHALLKRTWLSPRSQNYLKS